MLPPFNHPETQPPASLLLQQGVRKTKASWAPQHPEALPPGTPHPGLHPNPLLCPPTPSSKWLWPGRARGPGGHPTCLRRATSQVQSSPCCPSHRGWGVGGCPLGHCLSPDQNALAPRGRSRPAHQARSTAHRCSHHGPGSPPTALPAAPMGEGRLPAGQGPPHGSCWGLFRVPHLNPS